MVQFTGPGINSTNNHIFVKPSKNFRFIIMDKSKVGISYDFSNLFYSVDNHMVSIGADRPIKVAEHMFSALYGLELFRIEIEIWGDEFPIYDGSSIEYAKGLWELLPEHVPELYVDRPIAVESGDSFLRYEPGNQQLSINMEFSHPFINTQEIAIRIDRDKYIKEIAPARTFAFTTDEDERLKNLPAYGIGVTKDKIYAREPLRFSDELIRHKILDLLGDLYFIGGKLSGHIQARNNFHKLNHELVEKIKKYKI